MDHAYWCDLSEEELANRDVAEVNLALAEGLPGSESIEIANCLAKLDRWADKAKSFIQRSSQHYRIAPEQYGNSFAQFSILCMVTVLQRDLGVHYDPQSMVGDFDASNSRRLFIHGPLAGHGGTCVNLPVLFVAVGRRLGYPLQFVEAKEHLFVRWVGKERFNIEATAKGFLSHPDSHYFKSPKPLTQDDLALGRYLRELSPREVLAMFISERARCNMDNLRFDQALRDIAAATDLDSWYQARQLVIETMVRILEQLSADDLLRNANWAGLLKSASHSAANQWEAWAIPIAQRELLRMFKFAHKQHRLRWTLPEKGFSTQSLANLFTEIVV